MLIVLSDDGAGMNIRAIRDKAIAGGFIDPRQSLSDQEAMQLTLEPGFSTATEITAAAGRGVGMDVVVTEIKKLGGTLHIESMAGRGTAFTIRLPFTLAVSQALIVRSGEELYALPLSTIEVVVRVPREEVERHLAEGTPTFEVGGQRYRFQYLGSFIGGAPAALPERDQSVSVLLIRAGDRSTAVVADEVIGHREIVVKNPGPQVSAIRGIAGATVLGDGRVVIILDLPTLVRSEARMRTPPELLGDRIDRRAFVLVVDDSITVRRVTQRVLERNGMRVATAKDGLQALQLVDAQRPDAILLDIEMPRMDGYEVATQLRGNPDWRDIPVVMITSRSGDKHRARAIELGVTAYLTKPYQEQELLDALEPFVRRAPEMF
jgi:chemosensory pili system protein ChpA (sensor histidine kinase/response regulator)